MTRLKEIHAYDNSLIIIIGDHGYSAADDWPKGNIGKGMGMNALMIKDFGAKSPFKVTDQPIASSDIPNYVFEKLGLYSVSENLKPPAISNQQNIRRFFVRGLRKEEYVYHGYSEYIVMGHSWNDNAWIKYHQHPPGSNIELCIFNKQNTVIVIDKIDFQQKALSIDKNRNNSIHKLISITRIKDNEAEFIIKKPNQLPSFLNIVFSVGHLEPRLKDPHALVTYQINDHDPREVYANRGGLTFGFSWDVIIPRKDQEYPLTIKFHFCFGKEEDCREGKISQPFVYGSLAVFGIEKK